MKRDMELVRQILITIEDHPHGHAPDDISVPGYDDETIGYHLVLMGEAGLLIVTDATTFNALSPSADVHRMTWEGHEFQANTRNETVWNRAKATIAAKGGGISFEVLKYLVVETAKMYFVSDSLPVLPPRP